MLAYLCIDNIALIEHCEIDLKEGFSAVTGETGSGKSILMESIKLLSGVRFSKELIRFGCETASVEGIFICKSEAINSLLEENGIRKDPDGQIIIYREAYVSGKSICRINGRAVPAGVLRDAAAFLIDIHGQHENTALFDRDRHINLLDAYGGDQLYSQKNLYTAQYEICKGYKEKLRRMNGNQSERERLKDILKYQIDEIDAACISEEEEASLAEKRKLCLHEEKIKEALAKCDALINGTQYGTGALCDVLEEANAAMAGISTFNKRYADLYDKLQDVLFRLQDTSHDITLEAESEDFSQENIETIEQRLETYSMIKRKYGGTTKAALEFRINAAAQLTELENSAEEAEKAELLLNEGRSRLHEIAQELSKQRKIVGSNLEKAIMAELYALEMRDTEFAVQFEEVDSDSVKLGPNGYDKLEFFISPNEGEPLMPLVKIGSGGEISRIMLAIKSIISDIEHIDTIIFDEIDTGISGIAAQKVGYKLADMSAGKQVICVTHQAIIAAVADTHYLIRKHSSDGRTYSEINCLNYEQRVAELARILGGASISEATLEHARRMLKK